eukprot:4309645-Amphidinium_carterae.1
MPRLRLNGKQKASAAKMTATGNGAVYFEKTHRQFYPRSWITVNGKQKGLPLVSPQDETPGEMEKARVRAQALLKNTREELLKCRNGSKEEFEKAKQRGLERTAEAFGPALPTPAKRIP